MAPELLTENPKYTTASDVYALGWVFWKIMSSKLPYNDYSDYNKDIIEDKIKCGEHDEIPSQVPKKYADWIHSCWNIEPSIRPPDRTFKMVMIDVEILYEDWW